MGLRDEYVQSDLSFEYDNEVCGELIQVFEAEGESIYRFLLFVNEEADITRFSIANSDGSLTGSSALLLESFHGISDTYIGIIASVRMLGSSDDIVVVWDGLPVGVLLSSAVATLVHNRDLLMVNPGIDGEYGAWCEAMQVKYDACSKEELPPYCPLISVIVPLYNTPAEYLHDMINSVVTQTYKNWELILVNASPANGKMNIVLSEWVDTRIKMVNLEGNRGITGNTNEGIVTSKGDYISFLDHDDLLDEDALLEYAKIINEVPEVDLLYCDEDSFSDDERKRFMPRFKPDYNKDLLYSKNYITHFLMISRFALNKVELSTEDVDCAQDYDLTLKISQVARAIVHIPRVLYHWRSHPGSTNENRDQKPSMHLAGVNALKYFYAKKNMQVEVQESWNSGIYEIKYRVPSGSSISLLLVARSKKDAIRAYANATVMLEANKRVGVADVIVIWPGSSGVDASLFHQDTFPVVCCAWAASYDYAGMVRGALHLCKGSLILLCRDTVELNNEQLISSLAGFFERSDVGVVAPKMLYPDGLVQHAGLCVKEDGSIGYLNQNFTAQMGGGYLGIAEAVCDYSAVGPDCLMFRKEDALSVGLASFSGNTLLTIVDFCFKLRSKGKCIIVLPWATVVNRGPVIWQGRKRFDLSFEPDTFEPLWDKWSADYRKDVLFNPNVEYSSSYPRLRHCRRDKKWECGLLSKMKYVCRRVLGKWLR